MIETHDLFLRAIAVPVEKKKKVRKRNISTGYEPKWPDSVLAFDTESRITVNQSLTVGVWRRCKLAGQNYEVIEEGIFYADDLSARDLKVLTGSPCRSSESGSPVDADSERGPGAGKRSARRAEANRRTRDIALDGKVPPDLPALKP